MRAFVFSAPPLQTAGSSDDANLDGEVNILDVTAANKHVLGVGTLDRTSVKNADMNGSGTADSEDTLAILKVVLDIR